MKTRHKIALIGAGIATSMAVGVHALLPGRVGPTEAYPDPNYTVGKADTLNPADLTKLYNGQTYSQSHRNVPQSEKDQVCKEYAQNCAAGKIEIDHYFPVCAGASNDITNLWAEPEHIIVGNFDWGFHAKDKLEAKVCEEIKAGTLDPKIAFKKMTIDWIEFYKETFMQDPSPSFGSITSQEDNDDQ